MPRWPDRPPEERGAYTLLSQVPEPPCVRFECRLVERCRDERLACAAFRAYTTRGAVVSPYAVVMFAKDGSMKVKGQHREIEATAEIYLQVFEPTGSAAALRRAALARAQVQT